MKVKRLKEIKFQYGYDEGYDFIISYIHSGKETKLTKREFLALIKWGIGEMDLTFRQRKDIEVILEKRNIEYIRKKIAKIKSLNQRRSYERS
jgi:hypothetical protein